ncbi:MAG TPA: diaminopimelate epimerase [Myxococcales bacterium]|nr:diaminopimelate epimerase [Myxococcales bacterium]HAN32641.1 diaminopimelate epimerase [Myxococcales bacterium]
MLLSQRDALGKAIDQKPFSEHRKVASKAIEEGVMQLKFSKFHGLGNDFLFIDDRDKNYDFQRLAIDICDRNRGVGADGILLFRGTPQRPEMIVINSDGSVPEMCGNGLRCFVKALVERHQLPGDTIEVTTGAGRLSCRFGRDAFGHVERVSVNMGEPSLNPADVPLATSTPLLNHPLEIDDQTLEVTAVGVGNPHMVTFTNIDLQTRLRLGPRLSSHPLWPAQTNVEFCEVLPSVSEGTKAIACHVYERGCGWTQACGTGATAAAFAAVQMGLFGVGESVQVHLPGGQLQITIREDGSALMMGPAQHVFDGLLTIEDV